jgi:hypothetical protein
MGVAWYVWISLNCVSFRSKPPTFKPNFSIKNNCCSYRKCIDDKIYFCFILHLIYLRRSCDECAGFYYIVSATYEVGRWAKSQTQFWKLCRPLQFGSRSVICNLIILSLFNYETRDSIVNMVTRLQTARSGVWSLARTRDLSLQNVQISPRVWVLSLTPSSAEF